MAQAVIGALRVVLGINTAQFDKGLHGAQTSLGRFGALAAKGLAVASAAIAAGLGGVGVAVRRAVNEADDLGKLAQQIGIPVEELSRLKHAADLSGVSIDGLGTAAGRLSRNMSEVASGVGSSAKRAFDQLGVSVKNSDGTLKSSSQVMAEIAERFAAMPDGAQKTALAMQLMGRSGATMIPMLNGGAAALNAMMREADTLGLVIDEKTARAAERFNDNLTRLGRVKDGIITKLTAHLLPALESFSQRLINAANNSNFVERVSSILIGVFEGLGRALTFVSDNMGTLLQVLKVFIAVKIVSFVAAGAGAFITFAKAIRAAGLTLSAFTFLSRTTWKGVALLAGGIAIATGNFEILEEKVAALWARVKTLIPEEVGQSLADLFGGNIEATDEAAAKSLQTYLASADAAANSFGSIANAAKGAGSSVREAFDSAKLSVSEVGQTLESSFMQAFDSAIDGTFKFRGALNGLLKDLARMAANKVFSSLINNVGGGLLGGLGGLFGGGNLAQPAMPGVPWSFGSFDVPKFATGGSFRVGGSGGVDSKLMSFRATPGEMVDIHKPGQDRGGGQLTIQTVARIDEAGNIISVVERVSGRVAGQVVQYAAPGIIEQSAAASGGALGAGKYDNSMAGRYRMTPKPPPR